MMKLYTTVLFVGVWVHANAQQTPLKQGPEKDWAYPNKTINYTGLEPALPLALKPQPHSFYQKALSETVIGETVYDLQSNSSIQNRNLLHADGSMSASFTYGAFSPNFDDRGTGYNYSGGTWGAIPTQRVETVRSGWPSMLYTAGGTEAIISHAGSGPFRIAKRSTKGTGTWNESNVTSNSGQWMLWPRAVTGGSDGNSIHCIGISAPVGNGGTTYQGIDGALMYFRSQDQGATWDVVDSIFPALDSTHFSRFRADAYSIVADGDNIAFAAFNQWGDMVLMKSTDNGTNWTSQLINDFPLDLYVTDQPGGSDIDGDLVADTIETCDEAGALLFDNNGMVHVTFGRMRVLDADLSDGNTSYFPGTQELLYWNESMGTGNFTTIAVPEDLDGDLTLGFAGEFAAYFTALCGSPSMGKNADGTIFVSYAGYREDFFTSTQNFRHIYVTKTMDGGNTWETALDVTPDPFLQYYEAAFASMMPVVDNKIRLTYMRDLEPGLAVRGDMDAYDLNSIVYLEADTNLINDLGISELSSSLLQSKLYPNPTENEVELLLNLAQNKKVKVVMTNSKGEKMAYQYSNELTAGEHVLKINTRDLASGIYFIQIEIEGKSRSEKLIVQH